MTDRTLCPVCRDGPAPCYFRIGLSVWPGKKLRVCSTRCKRVVKAEVRRSREAQPTADKELLRRKVA